MKTINYELAKKLYDVGVVIESEQSFFFENNEWDESIILCNSNTKDEEWELWFRVKVCPAPNVEEVIEFLPDGIEIFKAPWGYTIYRDWQSISKPSLLESLEATLEYLLDNWHLWKQ